MLDRPHALGYNHWVPIFAQSRASDLPQKQNRFAAYNIRRTYNMADVTTVASVEDTDFDEIVLESDKPVVVDFWAPWCPPCRLVSPIVEELSHEYSQTVNFKKMNTDENENTMIQYGITSLPTLIIFKDGQEVNRLVGFAPKEQLRLR
jgi:thioredoxin 1